MTSDNTGSDLPLAGDSATPVPVYDCHVILSPPDADGVIHARVSTLPEITAIGRSERDVLQKIVRDFKRAIIHDRESGDEIPWQSPAKPRAGETQRWVPVHL